MTVQLAWDDGAAPASVSVVVMCPHCGGRYALRTGRDIEAARAHVLGHL